MFRLEREFGIKIPRGELFPESIFQGDPEFVQNGKVTDKGLAELRRRMPFADLSKFEKNPEVSNLSDLFTVELITRYIQGKLAAERAELRADVSWRVGSVPAKTACLASLTAATADLATERRCRCAGSGSTASWSSSSGKSARAVKNLSLAEDHFADHFPGYPVMPAALILEGLAQTGGILVGEANDFREKVVLAKVPAGGLPPRDAGRRDS